MALEKASTKSAIKIAFDKVAMKFLKKSEKKAAKASDKASKKKAAKAPDEAKPEGKKAELEDEVEPEGKKAEPEEKVQPEEKKAELDDEAKAKIQEEKDGSPLAVGDKCRLGVEDVMHKLRYGQHCVVKSLQEDTCNALFDKMFPEVEAPIKLLVRLPEAGSKEAKPLSGLVRLSFTVKQAILLDIGVEDPLTTEVTVHKAMGELAADQYIDVFAAVLRQNLGVLEDLKIAYVQPSLTRLLIEDKTGKALGADYEPASLAVQSKRARWFQSAHKRAHLLLIPVFSNEAPPHWTLLVVLKGSEVRYYDSLNVIHEGCSRNAKVLVELLGLEGNDGLRRCNVSRQAGVDCGWFVMHWIEDHVRAYVGQGPATQQWPDQRMKELKTYTKSWTAALEVARDRWATLKLKAKDQEDARQKAMVKEARALIEALGLLEALQEAQKLQAAMMLEFGQAEEPPPLPLGFGEKPKDVAPKVVLEAEAKAKVEETKSEAKAEEKAEAKPDESKAKDEAKGKAKPEEGKKKAEALKLSAEEELMVQMAVDNWKSEDLRPEFREKFERVRTHGVGICSSCRYTYGCLRCDEGKAWNYYVRQELGLQGSVAKKAKGLKK